MWEKNARKKNPLARRGQAHINDVFDISCVPWSILKVKQENAAEVMIMWNEVRNSDLA